MPSIGLAEAFPDGWARAIPVREGAVPPAFVAAAASGGFTGAAESVCDVLGKRRTILVGVGAAPDLLAWETAGRIAAARALREERLALDLRELRSREAAACLLGAGLRAWRYDRLRTVPEEDGPRLRKIAGVSERPKLPRRWAEAEHVLEGVSLARDLVTEPSNTLTPRAFLDRLAPLRDAGIDIETIEGPALEPFGGIAAVGGGSAHPPVLVTLRWRGHLDVPPVAFVGKGITFDTGGICIKPADKMWEMRADMAGAAACAGAMLTLARRRSPAPVIAVLALAENAIGGASYRPSDVLCSAAGLTVEVVDTDAEGRLVLMDALAFAAAQKPAAIIDLATLTGSIITALGHHRAGAFSNDPALVAVVAASGAAVGEPVWHMPLGESYRRALDSAIADLRHCSPARGQPDASQAACFLREFVGDVPWVHLDIAGVESAAEADDRRARGATGFGVRLLDQLVRERFESAP